MKRLAFILGLACCVLVCMPRLVRADALDDGVRRVGAQLMCPVCEGETVADSPSGLAADMRSVIRSRLAAGESDAQILDEFVASYGDSILTDPPKRGVSLGVWVGPIVAVATGIAVLSALLRSWRRPDPAITSKADSASIDATIVTEFRQFREDLWRM